MPNPMPIAYETWYQYFTKYPNPSEEKNFPIHSTSTKNSLLSSKVFCRTLGKVKKNAFLLLVKETETLPPPPFLTTSFFSDKDFLDWASPYAPPPLNEKKPPLNEC